MNKIDWDEINQLDVRTALEALQGFYRRKELDVNDPNFKAWWAKHQTTVGHITRMRGQMDKNYSTSLLSINKDAKRAAIAKEIDWDRLTSETQSYNLEVLFTYVYNFRRHLFREDLFERFCRKLAEETRGYVQLDLNTITLTEDKKSDWLKKFNFPPPEVVNNI